MKTLIAAVLLTAGMSANAEGFRPWGNVNTGEGYVANEAPRRATASGFQPWTDSDRIVEEYTTDERVAADFRKGIGFQPFRV